MVMYSFISYSHDDSDDDAQREHVLCVLAD